MQPIDRLRGTPSSATRDSRPRPLLFFPLLPFPLLLLVISGCASHGGILELRPVGSDRTLTQSFASAYITQTPDGEYDIVLVDHVQYRRQSPKKPLQPQPLSPTRQIMHLHLYWRPRAIPTTSNPAAVNAAIDWYVLGSDAAQDGVLYEGAGVVTIQGAGGRRHVTITEGTLRPRESRGAMQDPIGGARISGTFAAEVDRSRVREILNEMRQSGPGAQAASR